MCTHCLYLANEDVLWVEQVSVVFALYHVDHPRLQIEEQRSRNVVIIICLVEEDVFSIVPLPQNINK